MAMYDNPPIPTRKPVAHEGDPELEVGDRVRLKRTPGTMPGHEALDRATGTVIRVVPGRVVLEMDHEYVASGLVQRQFYSFPGELERIERVGRMGAVDLFADDQE
jgi:hypothetical protein